MRGMFCRYSSGFSAKKHCHRVGREPRCRGVMVRDHRIEADTPEGDSPCGRTTREGGTQNRAGVPRARCRIRRPQRGSPLRSGVPMLHFACTRPSEMATRFRPENRASPRPAIARTHASPTPSAPANRHCHDACTRETPADGASRGKKRPGGGGGGSPRRLRRPARARLSPSAREGRRVVEGKRADRGKGLGGGLGGSRPEPARGPRLSIVGAAARPTASPSWGCARRARSSRACRSA